MKLFDVKWKVKTAGPSPDDNDRVEVFLFGCDKAKSGNPCKGCFNYRLWDDSIAEFTHSPEEMAETITKFAPNKYVTIGGGEPTDQIDELIVLCRLLKVNKFHILIYTWKSLHDIMKGKYGEDFKNKILRLFLYIDILVDGEFIMEERVYNENAEDGAYNSVGSGNQIVWDVAGFRNSVWPQSINFKPFITGEAMRNIEALYLDAEHQNELKYIVKEKSKPERAYLR